MFQQNFGYIYFSYLNRMSAHLLFSSWLGTYRNSGRCKNKRRSANQLIQYFSTYVDKKIRFSESSWNDAKLRIYSKHAFIWNFCNGQAHIRPRGWYHSVSWWPRQGPPENPRAPRTIRYREVWGDSYDAARHRPTLGSWGNKLQSSKHAYRRLARIHNGWAGILFTPSERLPPLSIVHDHL